MTCVMAICSTLLARNVTVHAVADSLVLHPLDISHTAGSILPFPSFLSLQPLPLHRASLAPHKSKGACLGPLEDAEAY